MMLSMQNCNHKLPIQENIIKKHRISLEIISTRLFSQGTNQQHMGVTVYHFSLLFSQRNTRAGIIVRAVVKQA